MRLIARLLRAFLVLAGLFAALYGLGLTVALIARMISGETLTIIGLFNSLLPLILLPSFIFLIFSLFIMFRRKSRATGLRLFLLQLPGVIAFFALYSWYILPPTDSTPADNSSQMTIWTHNVYYANQDVDSVAGIVRAADPDLIALQELGATLAGLLADELRADYPHQVMNPQGESVAGKGFLSRYPITESMHWQTGALLQQRIVLDVAGNEIIFYNFHAPTPYHFPFGYRPAGRSRDITELLNRVEADTAPVIVAGDFNMSDQSNDYWRMTQPFEDAYRGVGSPFGFTFPDFQRFNPALEIQPPLLRIDYVFHSDDFRPIDAQVWPTSGRSDHRPLRVQLAYQN
jgi:endonuclease/exonuclease/phosphatase (EEP) superfamily protein YafD